MMPTMMRDAAISFPLLGNWSIDPSASFTLFGRTFYWYGVIIAVGFILAMLYCARARAAAPQHIRQHGRARRRRAPQLRQQVHAQPRGLELVRAQGGQPHAGENFRADAFHKIRSFRLWCVHNF